MGENIFLDEMVWGSKPCEPHIVQVLPELPFWLILKYATGEVRRFDVSPYRRGKYDHLLSNDDYYNQVMVIDEGVAVGWPQGPDIGPEDLYECSISVSTRVV